jgi:hypothetical protein
LGFLLLSPQSAVQYLLSSLKGQVVNDFSEGLGSLSIIEKLTKSVVSVQSLFSKNFNFNSIEVDGVFGEGGKYSPSTLHLGIMKQVILAKVFSRLPTLNLLSN